MKIELIDIVPVQNELGEGIIWDHQRQRIWWVDIDQSKLYRYDPDNKALETWDTPERLCCFAPVENSDYLVAAFASGLAYYEPQQGIVKWIQKIEQDNPGTRMNDGRTDRQGRFWAGSMVENQQTATAGGTLYCLDHQLNVTASSINNLSITNSLCWSPNSSLMYHCDTPKQTIEQYDFDADTGDINNKKTLIRTEQGCSPDGSIVDAEGFIWNAQWGGSKVVRYSASGDVDFELTMPVSQPSCVAFAGSDLSLLAVSTAYENLSEQDKAEQPNAGNVFIYQTDISGLIENPFKPVNSKTPDKL